MDVRGKTSRDPVQSTASGQTSQPSQQGERAPAVRRRPHKRDLPKPQDALADKASQVQEPRLEKVAQGPDAKDQPLPGGRHQAKRQEEIDRRKRVASIADAALSNDGDAQAVLSHLYRKGMQGVTRSKSQERYWKERAALNGKAPATHKKTQVRAAAHTDHFTALAKKNPANADPRASLLAIASVDTGLPADALTHMLDDLYKVPENQVILDTAARLAEMGHIKQIRLRAPHGMSKGGYWNPVTREVGSNYGQDENWNRGALMHELTHAVVTSVYNNEMKTYRTRAQKKELKQAIETASRQQAHGDLPLEIGVAKVMNEPFTRANLYDHKAGWKHERLVRIPQLLAHDYATRDVFEKKYAQEWDYFQNFRAECANFLALTAGTITAPQANAQAAPAGVIKLPSKKLALASSAVNEAVARAFGNTLGTGHLDHVRPEIHRLRDILKAYPQLDDWSDQKRAQFRDRLASFYARRMSRSLGKRRQYGFDKIDQARLEAIISTAAAALSRAAAGAPASSPAANTSKGRTRLPPPCTA